MALTPKQIHTYSPLGKLLLQSGGFLFSQKRQLYREAKACWLCSSRNNCPPPTSDGLGVGSFDPPPYLRGAEGPVFFSVQAFFLWYFLPLLGAKYGG